MAYPKSLNMKKLTIFSFFFILTISLLGSCTRENISYGDTTREAITKSQWSIDYYFAGQDRTAEFSNYKFSFTGNGIVKAEDGSGSFSGNWNMATDARRNDVLSIQISEAHLQSLNDKWIVNLIQDGSLTMKGTTSEVRFKRL